MIARIWQGITLTTQADSYLEFLKKRVLPMYWRANGNRGVYVLKNTQGEITHFLLFSLWSSRDEVGKFNSEYRRMEKLGVEEKSFLLAFEAIVRVYEVVGEPD